MKNCNNSNFFQHKFIRTIIFLLSAILFVCIFSTEHFDASDNNLETDLNDRQVLILSGFQYGLPVADIYVESLVYTLKNSGMPVTNIYLEYLNLNRKTSIEHREDKFNVLSKLSDEEIFDLIIALDQVAADFITNDAKDLFDGVPLVVSYDEIPNWQGNSRELIIAAASNDAEGTVKYAFDLFPNTKNVIFIMGKDDASAPFFEKLKEAINYNGRNFTIYDTSKLAYDEMLEEIANLPADTIGFYGSYFGDINGDSFVPAAVANIVSKTSNVPVFAFIDMHINSGLIGGSVVINEILGQQVALAAIDYFTGELILSEEPTRVIPDFYPLFDWQQLKIWGADADLLPSNTIFLNYEPTIWEAYKDLIIMTIIFILVLILLIIKLFFTNKHLANILENLRSSQYSLKKANDEILVIYAKALDMRDSETKNHGTRVSELSLKVAKELKVDDKALENIRIGALLHDIGKMNIPDSILLKPGKLSEEEWEIMKKHPVAAYDLLSDSEYLKDIIDIPYCHHEKWDGSGYPNGLYKKQIPLSARIFAIVDVFDALTSDRPYRKAWPKDKAIEYISSQSGLHFDPKIVEVFLNLDCL